MRLATDFGKAEITGDHTRAVQVESWRRKPNCSKRQTLVTKDNSFMELCSQVKQENERMASERYGDR